MTWIVGASSMLGYGVMISDVRISFADGTQVDLLRKAYKVGPFILAGFAGSVHVGMRLIDHLQRALDAPEIREEADVAWQPEFVINRWHPEAKKLFASMPEQEKALGAEIIIVGVSPNQNMGVPEFPRVYVAKLRWPDFTPEYCPRGLSVCHIGSGSDVERYTSTIAEHFVFGASSMQAEVGSLTGWSQMLGHSVARLVKESPISGIGPHVNIDTCRLGQFFSGNSDEKIHYPDGRIEDIQMPSIASSWSEFETMCSRRKISAAGAVA